MKKNLYLNFFLVALFAAMYGQDATFLNNQQFFVHQNPSFAGSNGGFRMQSVSWSQNKNSDYVAYGTSADAYLKKIKGGMALTYTNSELGKGTAN